MLLAIQAMAGTLSLGKPTVESDRYVFPVMYRGEAGEVAALDFRIDFDPAVFQPMSAEAGAAALAAGKQVSANAVEPGQLVVLMMGANRNTVAEGPIAYVAMRQIADPEDGVTRLTVSDTTFATSEGVEVPSRGSTRAVRMGETDNAESAPEPEEDPLPPDGGREYPDDGGDATEDTGSAPLRAGAGFDPNGDAVAPQEAGRVTESRLDAPAQGPLAAQDAAGTPGEPETARGEGIQPFGRVTEPIAGVDAVRSAAVATDEEHIGAHGGTTVEQTAGSRDAAAKTADPPGWRGRWLLVMVAGVMAGAVLVVLRKRLFP